MSKAPKTLLEAVVYFSDYQNCHEYMVDLRWGKGPVRCPRCGSDDVSYLPNAKVYKCYQKHERQKFSLKVGTIFEDSPIALEKWLPVMWMLVNCKNGISSYEIHRAIGVTQKTAWFMLQRGRLAMQDECHGGKLGGGGGEVEIDETYLALKGKKTPILATGRKSNTTKVLVVIAVEMLQPKGFGRIRIRRVDQGDYEHLMPFIKASVRVGAVIHSDGSAAYRNLEDAGYKHRRSVHLGSDMLAHESMPGVHRVASLLQRWMMGTLHGAVQPKHLDYYLDEFVFRFNRRTSRSRGLLFYRLLQQAVMTEPVTYAKIAGPPNESGE